MKINLKNVKTCVFGIQGSGKTYLVEHKLLKNFKHPFIYQIHPEDFKTNKTAYVYQYNENSLNLSNLERIAKEVKILAQKKKIDCFVLDEADLFLKSGFAISKNMTDLILNHRHYNLALIFISRRPQSIPTEIVESSENLFIFKIEGENVERKLKAIHPKIMELIPNISKNKHNFIYKHLGDEPIIYNAINTKNKISN